MQTAKSRPGSLNVPPKTSSPSTPLTRRKLKTSGSDSDILSSPSPVRNTTSKDKSPNVVDRRLTRSPAAEKKKATKASEMESQLAYLQDELKKANDQLGSSESCKKIALQEADEAKTQLASTLAELEKTQKQLNELSDSEDTRIQELRKISQDRDKEWQSELEAVQKQHSMDNSALASALNEIQRLKIQVNKITESEASQAKLAESAHAESHGLRVELTKTLELVEKLRSQLSDSRESEERALEEVGRAQVELEIAKGVEERVKSENASVMESYESLQAELEESKSKVDYLEGLVRKLQSENGQSESWKTQINNSKIEASQLKDALEDAEKRCLEIKDENELLNRAKMESCQREAELEAKLNDSRADCEELKTKVIENERVKSENVSVMESYESLQAELESSKSRVDYLEGLVCKFQSENGQSESWKTQINNLKIEASQLKDALEDAEKRCLEIKDANELLNRAKIESCQRETELEAKVIENENELKKSEIVFEDLKANLLEKEMRVQSIEEENERLKSEITRREIEKSEEKREALMKLGYLTEEAVKSSRKAEWLTEQLDAAQAAGSEMEAELRRLKVQSDQWRKAAEAAAGMLSSGKNEKFVGNLDNGGKIGSPYSEDEAAVKKNGKMLKKMGFGVLLKKGGK